jgi:hypothetical protein
MKTTAPPIEPARMGTSLADEADGVEEQLKVDAGYNNVMIKYHLMRRRKSEPKDNPWSHCRWLCFHTRRRTHLRDTRRHRRI